MVKTNFVRARGAVSSCVWVISVLAVACGQSSSSSPLAPGSSEAAYHLFGTVSDEDANPLPDAVVTIVDGPLAGTATRTTAAGTFELTGGPAGWAGAGFVTLRASREGFQTATQRASWQPSAYNGVGIGFFLLGSQDPIVLEPGMYTLTVTADLANARDLPTRPNAPCAGFPRDLASRSYQAEIRETPGTGFYTHRVIADDPTLRRHDLFPFYISGSYVGLDMEDAGIYENLPDFRYLQIGGRSSPTQPAIRRGSSVSVTFTGAVVYCRLKSADLSDDCTLAPADQIVEAHVCVAERHTLVFTKR